MAIIRAIIKQIYCSNHGVIVVVNDIDDHGRSRLVQAGPLTAPEARGWANHLLAAADQMEAMELDRALRLREEKAEMARRLLADIKDIDRMLAGDAPPFEDISTGTYDRSGRPVAA